MYICKTLTTWSVIAIAYFLDVFHIITLSVALYPSVLIEIMRPIEKSMLNFVNCMLFA